MCDEFVRGATEAGHEVEKIRVADKNIGYCKACYACRGTGVCAIKDDMAEVLQKMIDCDVMVLASPVYFYSIDAQLKAVIDRSVARWTEVKDKEFYYIVTAADAENESAETTLACFRGYDRSIRNGQSHLRYKFQFYADYYLSYKSNYTWDLKRNLRILFYELIESKADDMGFSISKKCRWNSSYPSPPKK